MSAELQYLKAIADSIKRLAGGKVGGAAAAAKAATNTITASANVEAPGVAETLDKGLLTTETQEEGGQTVEMRVSAVKTLGDRVLEELEAAFFTGTGAQRTTFFSQIHDELVRIKDLNHLGDLDDVTLSSPADKHVVMYDAPSGGTPAWKNVAPSSLLAPMMGGSQIGGLVGTDLKMMYWSGLQLSELTLGKAAGANIASAASDIYHGNGDLPTASAIADKLAGYLSVTLNSPVDKNVVMYDAPVGGTAAWKNVAPSSLLAPMMGSNQIGGYVNFDLKMPYWTGTQWSTLTLGTAAGARVTGNSADIYHGNGELPTGGAIYDFLQSHGLI